MPRHIRLSPKEEKLIKDRVAAAIRSGCPVVDLYNSGRFRRWGISKEVMAAIADERGIARTRQPNRGKGGG